MSALGPVLALMAAMLSFQVGATLAKSLFPVLGIEGTAALRLGFAALILIITLRAWRARLDAGNWQALLGYGVTLAGMNMMYYQAVSHLPLGVASAIQFLGPLTVAVLFSRAPLDFLWAALAAAGLLLLTPLAATAGNLSPIGIAWALGGASCWGLYIIFGRKAGRQHGARTTALGMTVAACIALPVGLNQAQSLLPNPGLLPIVIVMTLLSSVIPFTLEMVALRNLSARSLGTLMSLEPAISALVGLTILGERLTAAQTLAIGLIVAASVGTVACGRPREAKTG
jgi:inner membrane transporter RhtA